MTTGIYIIKNKKNDKIYVGSAVNVVRRWQEHKKLLRKNKHHSPHLQSSWNLDGEENFQFILIEPVKDPLHLIAVEQTFLDYYKSYTSEKGYNVLPTAGNWLGMKHTEESKNKMRGKNNHFYGKTHSEETKRKISEAGNGRKHKESSKRKISEAHKGKKLTQEHRHKMSIGRRPLPENCKGYYYHKPTGKYRAIMRINGKRKYLGLYNTPEEAREAYLEALSNTITDGGEL